MLIQKTFHLQMARDLAKTRLADFAAYYRLLNGVRQAAMMPEGTAHLQFRLPCGFLADLDVSEIPGKNPAQTLFRSSGGNMEVAGVLEYFQIKPQLTEVVLTIDYTIASPVFHVIDCVFNTFDRFLNRQLRQVEEYFNQPVSGVRADTNLPQPINGHSFKEEAM